MSGLISEQPPPEKRAPQRHPKAKQQARDTHFLCLPLVTSNSIPQLAKSIAHFRELTTSPALNDENGRSTSSLQIIPSVAIRDVGTYHLTLGVMNLSEPETMQRAIKLLEGLDLHQILNDATSHASESTSAWHSHRPPQRTTTTTISTTTTAADLNPPSTSTNTTSGPLPSLSRPISPPPLHVYPQPQSPSSSQSQTSIPTTPNPPLPLNINLTGLSTFPHPSTARVLYAKPHDPSKRLQAFAITIRQYFRSAGLITETRPLVLHATVVNMRYAAQRAGSLKKTGTSKGEKQQGNVDAREVVGCFDQFDGRRGEKVEEKEYVWAEGITVDTVAICKLGATRSRDSVLGSEYPPVYYKLIRS